ncbi:MAG: hypothetical protein EBU66_14410 [Bacteroidetes bacterium]|nr:hypothetical protein [Bacteroidota bacterium]
MVSKTREKSHQSNKRKSKRMTRTKKNQRPAPTPAPAPAPVMESHRFMSRMTFDGNTLTTQTQKDNEPVIERKYTKEQLAREIPIGKEMVDTYLDGKMPKGLQPRDRNHYSRPVFQNVLIGPADLGLLPPRSTSDEDDANKHLLRNGHHKTSKLRMKRRERERQRRRLYDNNTDLAETDGDLDLIVNDNKKHLFDLP